MKDLEIRIRKDKGEEVLSCPVGTQAESLVSHFGVLPGPLGAVRANNEILPLSTRLEVNTVLEPVLLDSHDGVAIYRRSLAFLLAVAARGLFPERDLYVGHSLGHGYYYPITEGKQLEPEIIRDLEAEMRKLVKEDLPISYRYMAYAEALERFRENRQNDTALLLDDRSESRVLINECKEFVDLYIAPLAPRTGLLDAFELMMYQDGFLLRFPASGQGKKIEPFEDSPKIFAVYNEYKKWGRIVGVHAVGHLNTMISDRTIREYIRIAEAFQEKKLAEIADRIYAKKETVRTILIAGPSSSGKTTTAKRLSIALKVMGIEPIAISLDDYYIGTDKTPLDENGKPDFECLEALDVPFLNEQLLTLLAGGEVTLPVFDFKTGRRRETGGKTIRLGRRTMLV
ncbi:MAG: nucleoside kinase, partial [Treponema sp.]|nr:nucleoside kinase [Treponema sp.]